MLSKWKHIKSEIVIFDVLSILIPNEEKKTAIVKFKESGLLCARQFTAMAAAATSRHGLRNRPRQCEQRRCNRVASSEQWWWRPQCSFYYSQQLKGKRDSRKTILTIACVVTSQILCLYLAKQFAANYSATIEVIPTSLPSDCQQVLQCFDYKISLAKVGIKYKNGLKIHRNELEILF